MALVDEVTLPLLLNTLRSRFPAVLEFDAAKKNDYTFLNKYASAATAASASFVSQHVAFANCCDDEVEGEPP
eukprot:gene8426-4888_t